MANIENKDNKKENKKRFVKALYSYVPVNNDELALKVHDILEVVEETEEGWWKGISDGNVGMFPSNFVIELDGHPEEFNNKLMNELSPTKNSSKGKNLGEQEPMIRQGNNLLKINKENAVQQTILSSGSGNEADVSSSSLSSHEIPEKKIITPNKKPLADSSAPRLPPKPVREQARALFPYEAQNEDELSLREGDIIIVISKEVEDKGWWKGELNNKIGVFPDNFVKLIKTEEQKKPERPDKPSTVIASKINLKSVTPEKSSSEFSPKVDKKVTKTPPAKPPPPELHKKDSERPLPPCPSKKPQPPHPVKKPVRVSIASKTSGFTNAPATVASVKSPISEASPPLPTYPPPSSEKVEEKKPSDSTTDIKDKTTDIKAQPDFDVIETSSKKLVHLTASRAKAPNRRPPSFIFLKENEKDASASVKDSRRRSEPLLAEMESMISSNAETVITSAISSLEKKPKVPPPRPFLPPSVKTSSTIKNSTIPNVKGSSLFEENSKKSLDVEKKDHLSDAIPSAVAPTLKNEIIPQKSVESSFVSLIKPVKSDIESHSNKLLSDAIPPVVAPATKNEVPQKSIESSFVSYTKPVKSDVEPHSRTENGVQNNTFVTQKEFNELLKQVKELTDMLEAYKSNSNKAISDLKVELEEERKMRRNIEIELQTFKDSQKT
nr:SH3 domain-containing kinase-binding protein 1 [Parasteatoda tepidariorum]XP_042899736.1 SH3 domain-containing kinase-binding protein 1 [Parasteatoda tepidariorum]